MGGSSDTLSATVLPGHWGGLRPLNLERDVAGIYALTHAADCGRTWQEMKVGPFESQDDFGSHVAELVADPFRAFFAIVDRNDSALGWLCLMEASLAHRSIELGYVLFGTPLQRSTLATEAFFLILAHVFDDLGYHRLEWTCTETNARSRRSAERLGFVLEGVMRAKLVLKGQTQNIALFSLLASEWPQRRQAMAQWLAPANFDNGKQLTALHQAASAVPGLSFNDI